jgi:hypothetical protein
LASGHSVGAASCYLREDFYADKAFLDGETGKDLLVIVITRDGELAGMGSWEREQDALPPGVSRDRATASRRAGGACDGVGRAPRARWRFHLRSRDAKVPHMQPALERAGATVVGFAPGYDREMVARAS